MGTNGGMLFIAMSLFEVAVSLVEDNGSFDKIIWAFVKMWND